MFRRTLRIILPFFPSPNFIMTITFSLPVQSAGWDGAFLWAVAKFTLAATSRHGWKAGVIGDVLDWVGSKSSVRVTFDSSHLSTQKTHLRCAQIDPLSLSNMRGVDDPKANAIWLRSLRRFDSSRWSRSMFLRRMYSRRSFSASQIARFLSSTCVRFSQSRDFISSMRRRRSSSFCSRCFWVASACAFSSSSFLCRSSFCFSFSCFIRSSRSFCESEWSSVGE